LSAAAAYAFELPRALEATAPPEARGLARDEVRLLVARRSDASIEHARFHDLPRLLAPGDLLVVNTSATIPAAIDARRADGSPIELRFGTVPPRLPDGRWWLVELRTAGGAAPFAGGRAGERLDLPGGAVVELLAPYAGGPRMWLARLEADLPFDALLRDHGRPVRYGYVPGAWPLEDYQTVFARQPGSAEMPSAARPFTSRLVTRLVAAGVLLAPLLLHAGLSSPERGEPPVPERFEVPEETARLVQAVRGWGGRVIAVGTTVVRALESAVLDDGSIAPGRGFASVVVTPERPPTTIDGLITGWHEPRASHLDLLEAVAGPALLAASYREALDRAYLWHEFGDSHLVLP
jgi:S-adenosylmethionine:tRNA ribosyltransferase-isomerase